MIPLPDKFMTHVDSTHDCWLWTGVKDRAGYGRYSHNSRTVMAHRVTFSHYKGAIHDGLVLDHLCGNKACVNPAHLEAVTYQVNTLRSKDTLPSCIHRDKRNAPCESCVKARVSIVKKLKQHGRSIGYFNNRIWRLSHPKTRQDGNKRYYNKSQRTATMAGVYWSAEEGAQVMQREYTDVILSRKLGRSVKAIQIRRSRLTRRREVGLAKPQPNVKRTKA